MINTRDGKEDFTTSGVQGLKSAVAIFWLVNGEVQAIHCLIRDRGLHDSEMARGESMARPRSKRALATNANPEPR